MSGANTTFGSGSLNPGCTPSIACAPQGPTGFAGVSYVTGALRPPTDARLARLSHGELVELYNRCVEILGGSVKE